MSRDITRQLNDLAEFERHLVSLFNDPREERRVMAQSERQLREFMTVSRKRTRSWGPNVLGLVAVAAAGLAVALMSAAVHSGLVHPSSTASSQIRCRLPVWLPGAGRAGFVAVPGGAYAPDASLAAKALPAGGPTAIYDAAQNRWLLPASQLLSTSYRISPDGHAYAYVPAPPKGTIPTRTAVHLVDLQGGGGDRVIWTGDGEVQLIAYTDAGVVVQMTKSISTWLVNPRDGSARQVSGPAPAGDVYSWLDAADGALWGTRASAQTTDVVRVSLTTGTTDVWLDGRQFPGPISSLGFDEQSHPVLRLGGLGAGASYSVVVLAAARQPVTIYAGRIGDGANFTPTNAIGDSRGIWFANADGLVVWLYRDGSLEKMPLRFPSDPSLEPFTRTAGGLYMNVAGPCQ